MKNIKERPILFSTAMVQAILSGNKTQTRRVVKSPIDTGIIDFMEGDGKDEVSFGYLTNVTDEDGSARPDGWYVWSAEYPEDGSCYLGQCPYGQVGDRLWVREAWRKYADTGNSLKYEYKADLSEPVQAIYKWKPSIHMPRAACRLVLEITNVRVERLQDISEEDAKAEGVEMQTVSNGTNPLYKDYTLRSGSCIWSRPARSFRTLWESINGEDSWYANPWVWVVEFKVVEGGANGTA